MKALVIVDVQNDFCPGGTLAVPNGDEVVPYINELIADEDFDVIITTQDWHPENHTSFARVHNVEPFTIVGDEMKWTDHCIMYTKGAELHNDLKISLNKLQTVTYNNYRKGTDSNVEKYSAYSDALDFDISECNVTVVGLATDYCVGLTALDIKKHSNVESVTVDLRGCRHISVDSKNDMVNNMKEIGIIILGD